MADPLGPPADVAAVLDAIEADQADPSGLNAFISIDREAALAAAAACANRRAVGEPLGPLDGVPVALKDNIDTAGLRTTMGSGVYADRVPAADAAVVTRLRAAGAIIVAKTNLTELACGTIGRNGHFGDCHNPHRHGFYPGGSSSGSAAAVAGGLVRHAVGTDTSCSVRHPAAACGIVGLKPTFGRVSNDGVSVCSRHLDHVGPMAATVSGCAELLAVMQVDGWDEARAATVTERPTVGVLTGDFIDECLPDVRANFESVLAELGAIADVVEIGLDVDLVEAEAHANVLCFDMLELYGDDVLSAPRGMVSAEVRDWFSLFGEASPSRYAEALEFCAALTGLVDQAMGGVDALVCATVRAPAGPLHEEQDRFLRMGNLAIWNMTGHPSLTIPSGKADNGMPLGLLINGRRGADADVLELGRRAEAVLK